MRKLIVGDRVRFRSSWLRNVSATYEIAMCSGRVIAHVDLSNGEQVVAVDWGDDGIHRSLATNLCRVLNDGSILDTWPYVPCRGETRKRSRKKKPVVRLQSNANADT